MAEIKTKKRSTSVEEFINQVPSEQKRKDGIELLKIFKEITKEKPVVWGNTTTGFIGFGQYHYKSERSSQEGDWPLTGFSPRKAKISIYIMSGFTKYKDILKKLGKYKISSGSCLYINKLSDIDINLLKKMIKSSLEEMKRRHKIK